MQLGISSSFIFFEALDDRVEDDLKHNTDFTRIEETANAKAVGFWLFRTCNYSDSVSILLSDPVSI